MLALIAIVLVANACRMGAAAAATPDIPSAVSVIPADVVQMMKIDLSALPADAPAAAMDSAAAVNLATDAGASKDHGPVIGISRGRAKQFDEPTDKMRTVWVVVYGPGGTVAVLDGFQNITLQVVLIDDQTGEYLRSQVESH
jgi:hypothetical protein